MDSKEVANRFAFHPATETTGPMHDDLRKKTGNLAKHFNKVLPESREKSLALTALQEAMMWGNAAIAIHSERDDA